MNVISVINSYWLFEIIINNVIAAVIVSLNAVIVINEIWFNACLPRTVELPQLNAARSASNAAIIVLSFQLAIGLLPNVIKYPPTTAVTAKIKKRFVIFSLKITAANAIAKKGWSFLSNTTTANSIYST